MLWLMSASTRAMWVGADAYSPCCQGTSCSGGRLRMTTAAAEWGKDLAGQASKVLSVWHGAGPDRTNYLPAPLRSNTTSSAAPRLCRRFAGTCTETSRADQ